MTTPDYVLQLVLPQAARLLPETMSSVAATTLLMTIGWQESGFRYRRQVKGPAVGFWQFERGGGVLGVLSHPTTADHMARVCRTLVVPATMEGVYGALEHHDVLAAVCARLLLWTVPRPIPTSGFRDTWAYYLDAWRPGKPHPEMWAGHYDRAVELVTGERPV